MAQATVFDAMGAKEAQPAPLSDSVFGVEANHKLINIAYNAYLANRRVSGASTLTRGEVRGGGKKPWRQKGTGRARAGSSRLPHWTGGGVAFGPTGNENHTLNLPVKAKRAAIRQSLSLKAALNKIVIMDSFDGGEGKVKPVAQLIQKLNLAGNIILVVPVRTPMIDRATRNMSGITVITATYLNVYSVINADWIVFTKEAQSVTQKWLEVTA